MQSYVITFRAMGCQVNVWLETAGDGAAILQQVPAWIEALEASLSRFRPESELNRLNARVGDWVAVSSTLYEAITQARRAARVTDGLVTPLVLPALLAAGYDRSFETLHDGSTDNSPTPAHDAIPLAQWSAILLDTADERVRLPGLIDLGGTAKGWTAEIIADRLTEHGPCLVDLGGDMVGRGKPWPVQLHDPFLPDTPFATFTLADRAVATSGTDYRRWGTGKHHIIDPRSGAPADSDLLSVTVFHPDAVLAEAFAKVVLLQGSLNGLAWLSQYPDAAGLAFDHEGRILATENIKNTLTPLSH